MMSTKHKEKIFVNHIIDWYPWNLDSTALFSASRTVKQNSWALSQVIDFTDLMQGGNSIPKTLLIQTTSNSSHCQTPYVCYRKESSVSNFVWHSEIHFSRFTHLFYFPVPLTHLSQYCTVCVCVCVKCCFTIYLICVCFHKLIKSYFKAIIYSILALL